jgi:hypothetical protein
MKKGYKILGNIKSFISIRVIVGVLSIVVSFLYFSPTLNAQLDIIDDHYYVSSGITTGESTVWNNFITAPEITSFGNFDRFRIVYYLINDVELDVFGLNPIYFYLMNIFVFAFFIFSVFHIAHKYLGAYWATIFTLFISSQKYFAYIFTRLGTAEVWAMLGLALYSLGFSSLYDKSKDKGNISTWKESVLMFVGAITMIGSKENFAIVGIFVLVLFFVLKNRKKVTLPFAISSVFVLLFNAYQIAHIYITQSSRGVDFKMNDVSFIDRISRIINGAFSGEAQTFSVFIILFFLSVLIFSYFCFRKNTFSQNKDVVKKMIIMPLVAGLTIFTVYVFNLYVYNGVLYSLHRYAFPSILVIQVLVLVYVLWISDVHKYLNIENSKKTIEVIAHMLLGFFVVMSISTISYSRNLSYETVQRTTSFQSDLSKMVEGLKNAPEYPIVFSSYEPGDHEPLIAVARYLRYFDIHNKIMIKNKYVSVENPSFIIAEVSKLITSLEQGGGYDFSPYQIKSNDKCFNIDFSGVTEDGSCEKLGTIYKGGEYYGY